MVKIDLEYPYNEMWSHGRLRVNSNGRRALCLYSSETRGRKTISYARYLLAVKHGRFLLPTEEADHIDEDGTNDSIDNLQILSPEANQRKKRRHRGRRMVMLKCPQCSAEFSRRKGNTPLVPSRASKPCCCSRTCARGLQLEEHSTKDRERIGAASILYEFKDHEID
jgi:hypothetical protein